MAASSPFRPHVRQRVDAPSVPSYGSSSPTVQCVKGVQSITRRIDFCLFKVPITLGHPSAGGDREAVPGSRPPHLVVDSASTNSAPARWSRTNEWQSVGDGLGGAPGDPRLEPQVHVLGSNRPLHPDALAEPSALAPAWHRRVKAKAVPNWNIVLSPVFLGHP